MYQAVDVEVVEKSLDVKEEKGRNVTALDTCLDRMDHAQYCVRRSVVVAGSKLTGGKKLEARGVEENALRDNPFQELATALQEGDGAVCLRHPVIYFTGFWNGDHRCRTPWVMPKAYSGVEE